MKRFLILFSLIAFVTVSCAGPSKVRWTKPDFRQDEYEKDQDKCFFQSIEQNLDSDGRWQVYVDCLVKKGYEFKEEPPPGNKVKAEDIGLKGLEIVLKPLEIAFRVLHFLIGPIGGY